MPNGASLASRVPQVVVHAGLPDEQPTGVWTTTRVIMGRREVTADDEHTLDLHALMAARILEQARRFAEQPVLVVPPPALAGRGGPSALTVSTRGGHRGTVNVTGSRSRGG